MFLSRVSAAVVGVSVVLNWAASASGIAINQPGVKIANTDDLPGNGVEWVQVGPGVEYPGIAIAQEGVKFTVMAGSDPPTLTPTGGWAVDSFFDIFYEIDFIAGGGPPVHTTGTGTARMVGEAPPSPPGSPVRTFDTEMLALDITPDGNNPLGSFMLRESPTRASTGQLSLTDAGGGLYHIDSFFDVFTELSIDGGQTWYQGRALPEPTGLVLAALGGLELVRRRRRRR